MTNYIFLIPALPFLGLLINGLFGKKIKNEIVIGVIATLCVAIPFAIACGLFYEIANTPEGEMPLTQTLWTWLATGSFGVNIAYQADQLSVLFTLIITGIGALIHIYSIGYMHGDRSFYRFFAYLNFFIFAMINLVLADNFLLTFLGWEGVGLASYLLIGFWYDKKFEGTNIVWTGDAGKKAFIANRVGDFGFLVAMFLIFANFGTLQYTSLNELLSVSKDGLAGSSLTFWITLCLFLGCCGKSAQLPLSVWLPDAMAGPTPVSALIHAATMVTAGIFLIARNSFLFALAPDTMTIVAVVGMVTALWAATIGLVQNDFKKVLAYSTVSQLGFMFAALGVGAFTAGVFHVMTHAFFKGLLFLGAGAVIHGMHDLQDIKQMGNIRKYMPITYRTFMVATLAISGIPLFSGFFSKDEIMWNVYNNMGFFGWLVLAIAAFCTAFYMFRLTYLVFFSEERFDPDHIHPHEAPKTMTFPLIILAILAAFGGFLGIPYALGGWFSNEPNLLEHWLTPIFASANSVLQITPHHEFHTLEYVFMGIAVCIALGAIAIAGRYKHWTPTCTEPYKKKYSRIYNFLLNKYYLDEAYYAAIINPIVNISDKFLLRFVDIKIVDGFVNGLARLVAQCSEAFRRLQTGIAQNYALLMVVGIVLILGWFFV